MRFLLKNLGTEFALKSFQFAYPVHVGHVHLQLVASHVPLATNLALIRSCTALCSGSANVMTVRCRVVSADRRLVAEGHVTDLALECRRPFLQKKQQDHKLCD